VWKNSEAEINVLFAIGNAAALFGILIGRLSGRWDARIVLIICATVFGITTILWGISPTWQIGLIPLLIAFAFSEGGYIAQQTVQAQITKPETRSSMIGIIITATGIFGGLGPTLGAWLIERGGNSAPFIASGIMAILTIGAVTRIKKIGVPDQRA
jgi:MFS family permease